jgi:hypothetical protein
MILQAIFHGISLHPYTSAKIRKSQAIYMKGDGISVAVLHLYDSFHQKCSKLGTVTTLGLKNKGREWKFKKCYFIAFSRPLKIYVF